MELIPGLPDEIAQQCLIHLPYNHFSTVLSVCNSWKQVVETVQFHRQRKSAGQSTTLVVLIQADPIKPAGDSKNTATPVYRLTVFEPESGEWSRLPPIPGYTDGGLPLFCECAGVGRKLVVIGGWTPATFHVSRSVHVYDFVRATWSRGADMPGPARSFFACASDSDGTVFVAGGHDEGKNALRSALAYDVETDTWTRLADMAIPRDECKGVFRDGKFCVVGGYRTESQGRFERSAETYEAATWRFVEEVLEGEGVCPRTCAAAAGDGKMYRCRRDHVAVMEGGEWRPAAELPVDVRVGSFLVTWENKVVMVCGSGGYGQPYSCYVADLDMGEKYTWRKVERPVGFSGHVHAGCTIEI